MRLPLPIRVRRKPLGAHQLKNIGASHEQDTKDQNSHHFPWNKGKLIDQKLPMKLTDNELIMLFHEH